MADLVTQPYLLDALSECGLTDAQVAQLPQRAAEASRLVRDWCGRKFTRATYDQLYSTDPRRPILLREYPVNAVLRCSTNPATVLSITQADASTNQRASVALSATGSADAGLVTTGLTLTRVASGVTTPAPLLFASYPTLAALAAAVAGLGGGWQATVTGGYGPWPTSDLRAVQGALPALAPAAAELVIHVDDAPFVLDEDTWSLAVGVGASDDAFSSPRWGGPMFDSGDFDLRLRPRRNGVRVVYDAGYDTIPEVVQVATAEVAKAIFERLKTDSTLKGESDGTYSWSARDAIAAIPDGVAQALSLYRATRA